jgi:hypothetical protein
MPGRQSRWQQDLEFQSRHFYDALGVRCCPLWLHEAVTPTLLVAMALVGLGIVLLNKK